MAVAEKKLSVEEYLELEKTSEIRHEYVDGELLAMAGEKRRHNRLGLRLARLLTDIADAKAANSFLKISNCVPERHAIVTLIWS